MNWLLLLLVGILCFLFAFFVVSEVGELIMFSSGMILLLLILFATSSQGFPLALFGIVGFILGGIVTLVKEKKKKSV